MKEKAKAFSVSIVIPVFNEQDYLKACLDSIKKQTVAPDEVIVVDNNSEDKSVEIAKSFPWVKLVNEKRQGIVFARNKGFNVSKSEMLARIDADSILPVNWVENIQEIATRNGSGTAVTGPAIFRNVLIGPFLNWIHRPLYFMTSRALFGHNTLFGSTMYIFNSDWESVKKDICLRNDIHEDMDLAVHLYRHGIKILISEELKVSLSGRRWLRGIHYPVMWLRTKLVH